MRVREEQKHRELEIQRRKMKNINISSPATGDLESLVALPVAGRTGSFGSSGLKGSPPVTRSAATDAVAKGMSEPSSRGTGEPSSQGSGEPSSRGSGEHSSQGTPKDERQTEAKLTDPEKGEALQESEKLVKHQLMFSTRCYFRGSITCEAGGVLSQ